MNGYERPQIQELGTISNFTRGEKFAWQLDGMTLAEAIGHLLDGGHITDVVGS